MDENKPQQEDTMEQTNEQPTTENLATEQLPQEDWVGVVETLQQEKQELQDKYLRVYAEFQNYKKRTARERLDLLQTAGKDVITALLPVLDDFDRAKKAAEDDSTNEFFSEGVQLVYDKLKNIMANQGLKPLESTGEVFNPDLHDAITEIPVPDEAMKGKIIDTVEKGYLLNDKLIRYAKVVVGK